MPRDQESADGRMEWLILVLGLAGIAAMFVPFAWGHSPIEGVQIFSKPSGDFARSSFQDIFSRTARVTGLNS